MSFRTVHFHGFDVDSVRVFANTVAEAIEIVTKQLACFAPTPQGGRKRIAVVGHDTRDSLYRPLKDDETEIHIVPQLSGGKSGGLLQIIIGAALIAASFLVPAAIPFLGQFMFSAGVMMVLGGIAQFLQPTPKSTEQEKSYYLGAPKNTVKIGTRIPILYGKARVYGHYISFDINARDNGAGSAVPANDGTGGMNGTANSESMP